MSTQDVAQDFTALCAKGEFDAAGAKYWSDDVVSRESINGPMARIQGRKAVEGKGEWWYANHEIHGTKVEGPYVNGDQFVVRFTMDVTPKGGERMTLDEMALYTVNDDKVVEEAFFPAGR